MDSKMVHQALIWVHTADVGAVLDVQAWTVVVACWREHLLPSAEGKL